MMFQVELREESEFLRCAKLWIKLRATKTNSEHKLKVFSTLSSEANLELL